MTREAMPPPGDGSTDRSPERTRVMTRPDPGLHFRRFLAVNVGLLVLSLVANLFIERPVFSAVHALMLGAVGISWWIQSRWGW